MVNKQIKLTDLFAQAALTMPNALTIESVPVSEKLFKTDQGYPNQSIFWVIGWDILDHW